MFWVKFIHKLQGFFCLLFFSGFFFLIYSSLEVIVGVLGNGMCCHLLNILYSVHADDTNCYFIVIE